MFHHSLLVYRELFAFSTGWARYKLRRGARAPAPRQPAAATDSPLGAHPLGAHSSSVPAAPPCWGHNTLPSRPALPWWEARSLWGVPSTLNSRESHGSARTCCTSTSVPGGKQLYSRLHYYMINNPVFPSDNIHNSPAPGIHFFFRCQVLLHTCCQEQ